MAHNIKRKELRMADKTKKYLPTYKPAFIVAARAHLHNKAEPKVRAIYVIPFETQILESIFANPWIARL